MNAIWLIAARQAFKVSLYEKLYDKYLKKENYGKYCMKYRSRTDIAAAVLDAARDGALKTQMMYKAVPSFPQIEEYLDLLIGQGLMEFTQVKSMYYNSGECENPCGFSKTGGCSQKSTGFSG